MADAEVADNNDRIFVRPISFLARCLENPRTRIDRLALRFDVYILFRIGFHLKGSVGSRLPITIALHLTPFDLCGEGDEKSHILFPYNTPKVLRGC